MEAPGVSGRRGWRLQPGRRGQDAELADDAPQEAGGGDVEGRVAGGGVGCGEVDAGGVAVVGEAGDDADFVGAALLDGDAAPLGQPKSMVERGAAM
jgi:hypothetical protein